MSKLIFACFIFIFVCSANASDINPTLNLKEFSGFDIGNKTVLSEIKLTGYEYEVKDGGQITFDDCNKAVMYGESKVKGYEVFRLRLLTNACYALEKYLKAGLSSKTYFPEKFEENLIKDFPAVTMPLLYKAQERHRTDKTIKQYYSDFKVNIEKNGSIKLLSEEDEIYYTLMARGDFTNDGIEDLLVKSEWFARKAFGKHVDLLILTKTGEGQPISINWRLMKP